MKSKIEKKSLFRKIVAVLCAITLIMSVSVPYAWAAAKDVKKITLTFDDTLQLLDTTDYNPLEDGSSFTVGTKKINVTGLDAPEGKTSLELTVSESTAGFTGVNSIKLSIFDEEGYEPTIEVLEGTTRIPTITLDEDLGVYNFTIQMLFATSDLSYSITKGNPPEAPKYDVYFTPASNDEYNFTDIAVDNVPQELTDDAITVEENKTVNFKVNANPGYEITQVKVDGSVRPLVATNGIYSTQIKNDTAIIVTTKTVPFNIDYEYDINNTSFKVEKGAATADSGTTYNFYVYPQEGYGAPQVTAESNGSSVDIQNNGDRYWFTVTGDTTISITAGASKAYTVTMNNGTGYTLSAESTTVEHGKDFTFTLTLDPDYNQSKPVVTASNATVTDNGNLTYTIKAVTADTVISVSNVVRNPFTISGLESGEGYTVTGNGISGGKATVTAGNDYSFYITTQNGYEKPTVTADNGAEIFDHGTGQYTITNITSDINVTITKGAAKTYSINYTEGTGYTFTDTTETATHGAEATFKVNLAPAYSESNIVVKANNVVITPVEGIYTITNVTADTTVTVSGVVLNTYTISGLRSAAGYTVQGDFDDAGNAQVTHGNSYTFYVTADEGCQEPTVTANGKACIKNGNQYIIQNITSNVAVTISAGEAKAYSITLNEGTGFKFKGFDTTTVTHGGEFSFSIQLDEAYSQSQPVVKVNGTTISAAADGVYTIQNITANTVVDVTNVVKNTYRVSLDADNGATVTANGGLAVTYGETFSFTVALNAGYELGEITVNGEKLEGGKVGVNTVSNVTGDLDIHISASKAKNTITLTPNNSKVEGIENGGSVEYGNTVTFTVTPDAYYKITKVIVNGTEYSSVDGLTYTVINVTTNLDITVLTSAVTLTVNINGNGFAKDLTQTYSYDGTNTELTIAQLPQLNSNNPLYKFAEWTMEDDALRFDATTDKTVELTANWTVNKNYLADNLTLTTQHQTTASYNAVTIRTYIEANQDLMNNEIFKNAEITAFGTILTKGDITATDPSDLEDKVMNGQVLIPSNANGLVMEGIRDDANNKLVDYYHSGTSVNPTQLGTENFIRLAVTGMNETSLKQYKAIGWIQLKIGNETIFLTCDQWDTGLEKSNDTKYNNNILNP